MTLQNILNINWRNFNIWDVVKGCGQDFLVDMNRSTDRVKKVQHYRLSICETCHMKVGNTCDNSGTKKIENVETGQMVKGCGCMLNCKTALLSQECPASLWKAVIENTNNVF